jgi:hypothetical protein
LGLWRRPQSQRRLLDLAHCSRSHRGRAAVLRPNLGIIATAAIIVADVVHNVAMGGILNGWTVFVRQLWTGSNLFVDEQIGFMAFVLATAAFAWKPSPQRLQVPAP